MTATVSTLDQEPARRVGRRSVSVVPPSIRDSRLHVAFVLLSVQVLGQTVLGFELSIAQILVSLLTCGLIEFALTLWRQRIIAWPASALLTGNGVALILRVNGTEHGDWWSMNGASIFAATAALSLLTKYVIRVDDRPLFNPSNIGLVACFLIIGTDTVNPLDFWWGPFTPGLALAYALVIIGGVVIGARNHVLGMCVAFWLTLAGLLGVLALSGHCMVTRWHVGAVCGGSFWWVVVSSPEVLIFMFFMITDPKSAPLGARVRVLFGAGVGVLASLLIATQQTEFGTKVAILAALAMMCLVRPLLERLVPAESLLNRNSGLTSSPRTLGLVLVGAGVVLAGSAAAVIALGSGTRSDPSVEPADAIAGVTRPDLRLENDLPQVAISKGVRQILTSVTAAEGRDIALDFAENLEIERQALLQSDPELLRASSSGERLAAMQEKVASGAPVPNGEALLERIELVLVREPGNPQAPPRLAVDVSGSVDGTFTLAQVDGHFLIDGSSE